MPKGIEIDPFEIGVVQVFTECRNASSYDFAGFSKIANCVVSTIIAGYRCFVDNFRKIAPLCLSWGYLGHVFSRFF